MQKKVIYLSYDGMTDPLGQSQVIPYMKGLATAGYSITILSAEKMSPLISGSSVRKQLGAFGILWVPVAFSSTIAGWSTLLNFLRLKRKAYSLSNEKKFDIIHCRSYIPALIGFSLRRRFGSKIILHREEESLARR